MTPTLTSKMEAATPSTGCCLLMGFGLGVVGMKNVVSYSKIKDQNLGEFKFLPNVIE